MAIDVAALLKGYDDSTAALLRSAGLQGDPVSGGTPAPEATATGAAEASTAASEDSPLAKFVAGYQSYVGKRGGHVPLLEALAQRGSRRANVRGVPGVPAISPAPVSAVLGDQGNALERALSVRQSGPRAGTAFETYELGDGRRAHVSYSPQGKRSVFVFRPK